jgi:tetratricopeptide (TPR) repeat protein
MRSPALILLLAMVACGGKKAPETPVTDNTNTTPAVTAPAETPWTAPPSETPPDDPKAAEKKADAEAKALREQVNQAAALLTTNNPTSAKQAADLFDALTKQHPDLAEAWVNLGVARHQMGDDSRAEIAWVRAAQRNPKLGNAWLYLGVLKEENADLPGALETYRKGIENAPDNEDLRVALVGALRKSGDFQQAIEEAHAALKINSNSVPIYNNLGLAYLDAGNLDLAQFVYQKAVNDIVGASENPYIRSNLGWIMYKRGQKGAALFNLQAAVKDPNTAPVPALVFLSQVYMDDRNYGDVVPLLENAQKQQPNNHGVLMNLGLAYRGVGKLDDAKRTYTKALEVKPENPDPYFNLGVLYGDYYKQYDEAKQSFQKYIDMGGKDKALALEYIAAVDKEAKKAQRKAQAAQEKAEKDAERKRQDEEKKKADEQKAKDDAEKARQDAEKAKQDAQQPPPGDTPPPTPPPGDSPAPEPAPPPDDKPKDPEPSPWGNPP